MCGTLTTMLHLQVVPGRPQAAAQAEGRVAELEAVLVERTAEVAVLREAALLGKVRLLQVHQMLRVHHMLPTAMV